ncbi:MAG: FAD-dependent monooxygenase [Balneola sp.]
MSNKPLHITIVGGGPVGLFLGIALSKLNIECTVVEKRSTPVQDSRSLGIHPISLELFSEFDLDEKFLKEGIQIKKGIAHNGLKKLGEINFEELDEPYNFILACPQFTTEQILTQKFLDLNPHGLITEAEVKAIHQNKDNVVCWHKKDSQEHAITSDFLIGCDGKNSFVRESIGIRYDGKKYPDTYIMGDFKDITELGEEAVVFLPKSGMIESFPLPKGMRRWVVRTESYIPEPSQKMLTALINARIGYDLSRAKCSMLSTFGVQHFMAEEFYNNRIVLAGDAAHVVSPIGGQGMNLGWIGAWTLARSLADIQNNPSKKEQILSKYNSEQRRIVNKAARRAELNMFLGREQKIPWIKSSLVFLLLNTPLRKIAAQLFAMKNLYKVRT